MTDKPTKIAVITGDLVNSTALGADRIERAMQALRDLVGQESHWMGQSFTRQSGDGWQLATIHPQGALRTTLAMRAALRSLGTKYEAYYSIAIGKVTGNLPNNLNESTQEVFVNSGRELQILKERAKRDGVMIKHWGPDNAASVAILADHISQRWTPAQASAMLLFLDPYSDDLPYTEAAERLGISRQAITKSLKSAGKDAILKSLFLLEAYLRAQENEMGDET